MKVNMVILTGEKGFTLELSEYVSINGYQLSLILLWVSPISDPVCVLDDI